MEKLSKKVELSATQAEVKKQIADLYYKFEAYAPLSTL